MAVTTIKNKKMDGAEVLLQKFNGQYSLYLREYDVRAGVLYPRAKIHQILSHEGCSLA